MTLELILWLVAWVVLSEVAFIISYSKYGKESLYHWGDYKGLSFFFVGFFILIQAAIVFTGGIDDPQTSHYTRLVYEAIIIAVIVGLCFGNSLISKKIDNWKLSTDKSRKKRKKK